MKIDMSFIPDARSGNYQIITKTKKETDFYDTFQMWKTGRFVPKGEYKVLMRDDVVVMSNTPDEIRDFVIHSRHAKGNILINGLGLGCFVKYLLDKDTTEKITVIEISEDVISLVAPYFSDSRLNIIHADAFQYVPDKNERFNFVWHDIWDYISTDNLPEMSTLHRKYGRKTDFQASWAREICERYKRQEKRSYSFYF